MMEPTSEDLSELLKVEPESASDIIKGVYEKYISTINEKLELVNSLSSMWANRNVEKTSSGRYGKQCAEAFLLKLKDASDTQSLLNTLLEHGSWGTNSRRLVFLCIDLIVGNVNEGQVPETFYSNPAKPFSTIHSLVLANDEDGFIKNRIQSQFRLSALKDNFQTLRTELPLQTQAYESFVEQVKRREIALYQNHLIASSRRI